VFRLCRLGSMRVSIASDSNDNLYIGGTTAQGVRRIDAISGITNRVVEAALADLPATPEPVVGHFGRRLEEVEKSSFQIRAGTLCIGLIGRPSNRGGSPEARCVVLRATVVWQVNLSYASLKACWSIR
jgi:hypothetical protein